MDERGGEQHEGKAAQMKRFTLGASVSEATIHVNAGEVIKSRTGEQVGRIVNTGRMWESRCSIGDCRWVLRLPQRKYNPRLKSELRRHLEHHHRELFHQRPPYLSPAQWKMLERPSGDLKRGHSRKTARALVAAGLGTLEGDAFIVNDAGRRAISNRDFHRKAEWEQLGPTLGRFAEEVGLTAPTFEEIVEGYE